MARATDPYDEFVCSFCGKWQRQVQKMIAGPGVYICDECVELCNDILDEEFSDPPDSQPAQPPRPCEIYSVLNRYIVGQEHAKRALSVAVYTHYKRLHAGDGEVELQKSNVLLLGPTGSGKTLLAQTLARIVDLPFALADASVLTEAGYVGEDVESILAALIRAADYDVNRAQTGIVYIDEIDKIACRSEHPSTVRDVSGEGVQQALLTMLEGTILSVPSPSGPNRPQRDRVAIDTTNILFICGGAFEGLEQLIARRTGRQAVGFGAVLCPSDEHQPRRILEHCLPQDLVQYGLIPEFVSRLPVACAVHQLSCEELIRVLTEPRNALLRQVERLFQLDGIELEFTEDALRSIAERALDRRTGARGLRSIVEELLLDAQFELPSRHDVRRCVISRQTVECGDSPTLELAGLNQEAA